jgi:hypothetical protein
MISIAIVIPTRNRADLAIEAVRSLFAVADSRLQIIVSNNSSDPHHVEELERFCERSSDVRLIHVRPPKSLAMSDHWDWAIERALDRRGVTHVGLHYDRRLTKPDFGGLFDLIAQRPDRTITYYLDASYPAGSRFYVHHMPWSGGLYEIETRRALHLASRGQLTDRWQAFPVLINCVTPRAVLERVRARFGSFCVSTTPDAAFGLRLCAVEETYLHLDRPLAMHYAFERSNGLAYLRGELSATYADYRSLLGDRPWLDAAPIPGLSLGQNIFWHEYALTRRQAADARFPPIAMDAYLDDLARGLDAVGDPVKRSELRNVLLSHGWRQPSSVSTASDPRPPSLMKRLRTKVQSLRLSARQLRADHVFVRPEDFSQVGFKLEARALRHGVEALIPPIRENEFLLPFEPVRIQ